MTAEEEGMNHSGEMRENSNMREIPTHLLYTAIDEAGQVPGFAALTVPRFFPNGLNGIVLRQNLKLPWQFCGRRRDPDLHVVRLDVIFHEHEHAVSIRALRLRSSFAILPPSPVGERNVLLFRFFHYHLFFVFLAARRKLKVQVGEVVVTVAQVAKLAVRVVEGHDVG